MTLRRRIAIIAASSLLLAGCAVPGQGGSPGDALAYDGTTATIDSLDALAESWAESSQGFVTPGRQQLATFAVLGPDALVEAQALAEEAGAELTLDLGIARSVAQAWFEGVGAVDADIPDEVAESMLGMLSIYLLAGGDTSLQTASAVSDRIAADGSFSPRLGEYSTDALVESLNAAIADAQGLPGNFFIAFIDVSAFDAAGPGWAARG